MNVHQPSSVWQERSDRERSAARRRRFRVSSSTQHIFFCILGTLVAIAAPVLLVLSGLGMSRQKVDVASTTAFASLFAILCGFIIIRRLLRFPLLRTYSYVALTFVTSFVLVALGLKFF